MTLAIVLAMSLRPPTGGIPTSGISSTTAAKEARFIFLAATDAETGSVGGGAASSRSSAIRAAEAVSKLSGIRVAVIAPNSPPV